MSNSAVLTRNEDAVLYQSADMPTLNTELRVLGFSTVEQQRLLAFGKIEEKELRRMERAIQATFNGFRYDAKVLDVFEGERELRDKSEGNLLMVKIKPGSNLTATDGALKQAVSRATGTPVIDIRILRETSR